jgi:DNA-binding beta-propeller fold protein YncE
MASSLTRGLLLVLPLAAACGPAGAPSDDPVEPAATEAAAGEAPGLRYEVDPFWPTPLPPGWLLGNVVGVATDSADNVWIIHRPNSQTGAESTPPVIAFSPTGEVIESWGGPGDGYDWGTQTHGIYVDFDDNVWIGFGGGLPYDPTSPTTTDNALVLKFTPAGDFLLQIGDFGRGTEGSASPEFLGQPTDIFVDANRNEVLISDGYTNRRVAVFNATTGEPRRLLGAYGNEPDDDQLDRFSRDAPLPPQFSTPHCVAGAHDGRLYVCDRGHQRIQVFDGDGTFLTERVVEAALTDGVGGTPWDVAFSADDEQRYLFVADGGSHAVHVLDRDTLDVVESFGRRGRWAGQFESPHSLAVDSTGALFVGETLDGRRVQKFVPAQ